jgi:hypothetical protein
MPIAYLTPAIEERAVEVQMLLTQSGDHRAPGIPDLLIAATAEKLGMSVLHATRTSTSSSTSPASPRSGYALMTAAIRPNDSPHITNGPEQGSTVRAMVMSLVGVTCRHANRILLVAGSPTRLQVGGATVTV